MSLSNLVDLESACVDKHLHSIIQSPNRLVLHVQETKATYPVGIAIRHHVPPFNINCFYTSNLLPLMVSVPLDT